MNLEILYELVIKDYELTSKLLKENNLNIKELINNGIIEKVKFKNILDILKGRRYKFTYKKGLLSYGKSLINKDNKKAKICFSKCLEFKESYINLMYILILENNYQGAYNYFCNVYDDKNNDDNFYLFLFSLIINTNKKVLFDDIQDNDESINMIRELIYKYKFNDAKRLIERSGYDDKIVSLLLSKIINIFKNSYTFDTNLARNKKYDLLIANLEKRKLERRLSKSEVYTLILCKVLLELEESMIIPEIINENSETPFEAIYNRDYKKALELVEKYCRANGYIRSENILFLLLREINKKINNIEAINKIADIREVEIEELPDIDKENEEIENEIKRQRELKNKLLEVLNTKDLNRILNIMLEYLKLIGQERYLFLIIDLIKLERNDVLDILESIEDDTYNYQVGEYINKFYQALSIKNYDEARIYLDILRNSYKLGQENPLIDIFERMIPGVPLKEKVSKKQFETKEEQVEESILVKIDETYQDGIAIIDDINIDIEKYLYHHPNIVYFEFNKQIILRHKITKFASLDIKGEITRISDNYKIGNYPECVRKGRELLQIIGNPKANLYALIGLAERKLGNLEVAIKYLKVSDIMALEEGTNYNHGNLIRTLESELQKVKKIV